MEAPFRTTLRRRIVRRPRYQRDDLRIEIRDDSSDGEDSPSPASSTFPPGVTGTKSPKETDSPKLPPPPPVLNPANPSDSTTRSATVSAQPTQPTQPPPPPPQRTAFSSVVNNGAQPTGGSFATAVPNSEATSTAAARTTAGPTRGGNDNGLGDVRSDDVGWTPTAIAFGTIAIAAAVLCVGWGLWWFLKYRKRRKARQYQQSMTPDDNYWNPESTFSPSTVPPPKKRSASSLMAEIMGHVYGAENGSRGSWRSSNSNRNSMTPQGYLDEKKYDPERQLPVLEPAPVAQPNVRNSIASWIRRHHPLKLNPLSGRSSVYSTRTIGASNTDVNAPPVPVVPDAYRSASQQSGEAGQQANAGNPPGYTASRDGTDSILSFYGDQAQQPQPLRPGQAPEAPWLQDPPPVAFNDRGVSMAPTEATTRTESTWRSWGGGVTQPRDHTQQQPPVPQTPRRGWIEKCIKFGGLK